MTEESEGAGNVSAETQRMLYDRLMDAGGIADQPVEECIKEAVLDMREHQTYDFEANTEELVAAAYDVAADDVRARKRNHSHELVAEIEEASEQANGGKM